MGRSLAESIDRFSERLYEEILKVHKSDDEIEFGTWDHFWLSYLIMTWLKIHKENSNGVNSSFWDGEDFDDPEVKRVSQERQDKVYQSLIDGFAALAHGEFDEDNKEAFDKHMNTFRDYYLTLWD